MRCHRHQVAIVEEVGRLMEAVGMRDVLSLTKARMPVVKCVFQHAAGAPVKVDDCNGHHTCSVMTAVTTAIDMRPSNPLPAGLGCSACSLACTRLS